MTGIFVRAQDPADDKWGAYDIAQLDAKSLKSWLKSRGGDNEWAESTVLILLGYNPEEADE